MSYGNQEKQELKESNYFNPGINQNATIKGEFRSPKKDGSGDKILCIDITGERGQKFTITEWPGDDDKKITNQTTRLRRWVKEVTGEDTFGTQFSSFEDMANQFCAAVNGKGTLLEFKLVYKEGTKYLEMPKYDGCVRAMSNPSRLILSGKEASKLVPSESTPSTEDELGLTLSVNDSLDF